MKTKILNSLILCALSAMTHTAHADIVSIIFKPTVILASACSISSSSIAFGDLTATGSPATNWATGTISAKCTRNTAYNIQLNYGLSVDSNNYRRMTGVNAGEKILYTVCQTKASSGSVWGIDSGCVVPWRGSSFPLYSSGTGNTQTFTMYAMTQTNYYRPDNYTDTMTATLVY